MKNLRDYLEKKYLNPADKYPFGEIAKEIFNLLNADKNITLT
jgi:hypothetical protein